MIGEVQNLGGETQGEHGDKPRFHELLISPDLLIFLSVCQDSADQEEEIEEPHFITETSLFSRLSERRSYVKFATFLPMESVYYGQQKCGRESCRNKAYWSLDGLYLCGVHARDKTRRQQLPKLPKERKKEVERGAREAEDKLIEGAAERNRKAGRMGEVRVSKLRMMKTPEEIPGFWKVFPNFKHGGRMDGLGCRTLSPMYLGPVNHGQPGLPPALNIENFHQGSKCFREEVTVAGYPGELYHLNRLAWYQDPTPHRHKYKGNAPLYFAWVGKDGKENYLDYVLSRQFYCTIVAPLLRRTSAPSTNASPPNRKNSSSSRLSSPRDIISRSVDTMDEKLPEHRKQSIWIPPVPSVMSSSCTVF